MQYVFTQYSGENCSELMHCGRKENTEERMKHLESVFVYDKEVCALQKSGQEHMESFPSKQCHPEAHSTGFS